MADFARNLTIGFAAASFLMAVSSVDISRTEGPDRPAQLAEIAAGDWWPDFGAVTGDSWPGNPIAQPQRNDTGTR